MGSMLLFEPHWEGHFMRYASWVSNAAASLGHDVRLATSPEFLEHPFFFEMQRECGGRIQPVALRHSEGRPVIRWMGYKFHYHRMFSKVYRRVARRERPECVFVPYLDYCAHAASLVGSPFGRSPWGGIFVNSDFHLKEMGIRTPGTWRRRFKERLFFRLLSSETLKATFTLDESLVHYARERVPDLASKLIFLPEPVELKGLPSREIARKKLGLDDGPVVILVYGVLDRSKGIDALLDAAHSEEFPEEATLLLAGPQDASVRALLASPRANALRESGRLVERDEFLHGEEESAMFGAADVVWVGYRGQYISSGVLIQAGMAGLPVVACDEGVIGWLTEKHDLGFTVDIHDTRAVGRAILALSEDDELRAHLGEHGKRLSAPHAPDKFEEALGRELRRFFPDS